VQLFKSGGFMGRPRSKAHLEEGARLSLTGLRLRPNTLLTVIWTLGNGRTRSGNIHLKNDEGHLSLVDESGHSQGLRLIAEPRHLGGCQWYFICPRTGARAAVIWRPLGASCFASRQAWKGRAGYASQSIDAIDLGWNAKRRIAKRLGSAEPHNYAWPPKPKGMRWATYDRLIERFNAAQKRIDRAFLRHAQALLND
jgi:hypothetical protein